MTNPAPKKIPQSEILMCAPDYYGVSYVINPWMEGKIGTADNALARKQWDQLAHHLRDLGATLHLLAPQDNLPDLVFTANAGLIWQNQCVLSRFRHPERQREEEFFRLWFEDQGFDIIDPGEGSYFEGAGDALFQLDAEGNPEPLLFAASGFRTNEGIDAKLAEWLKVETVPLKLVNPHFYHLDTCFCPLPGGHLLWYPPAFDAMSQSRIMHHFAEEKRYAMAPALADIFACNAVVVGKTIVMNGSEPGMENWLQERGFNLIQTSLTEFIKAGGAAKCLTLKIR